MVNQHWRVGLRRNDDAGAPISRISWQASSIDEYGRQQEVVVNEVGLGRYALDLPLQDHDRLTLRVIDQDFDKLKVLHWRRPYPAEYSLADKPLPLLEELPDFSPEGVRDDINPQPLRRPLARHALFASLALMLAGLVLRRV